MSSEKVNKVKGILEGALLARRISQKDVAKQLGISESYVTQILQGKKAPSARLTKLIEVTFPEVATESAGGVEGREVTSPTGETLLSPEGLTKEDLELLELLKSNPEKYLAAKDLLRLNNEEVFGLRVEISQKLKSRNEQGK